MNRPDSHPHRCHRCRSPRVGRARSRTSWQRFVKDFTPFERYACGDCGHRGWRLGTLHLGTDESTLIFGLRGVEERDRRAVRSARRRLLRGLVIAVVLGGLTAVYLLRNL